MRLGQELASQSPASSIAGWAMPACALTCSLSEGALTHTAVKASVLSKLLGFG